MPRRMLRTRWTLWILPLIFLVAQVAQADGPRQTENVILITIDGVRIEELFGGLDLKILKSVTDDDERVEETALYRKYWAPTPVERRLRLMPFFWGTLMAHHGSVAGNPATGSRAELTNGHRFSYPGYAEILTGQAHDEVINSNDAVQNPFPTVLEFVKKELWLDSSQVATFATWERFNEIAEHEVGATTINAGLEAYDHPDPAVWATSRLQFEMPNVMGDSRFDAFTFRLAMAHLRTHRPRVLYISFGETDSWSHAGYYDRLLEAERRFDSFLRELWDFLEADDQYRGKTSILIATDHGRGNTPEDWRSHGSRVEGAQYVWMAFISPDSQLRGEWQNAETVYQNQIAATLARFLGLDFLKQNPDAGKPIEPLFAE